MAQQRVNAQKGNIADFMSDYPKDSPAAVETVDNWYWIVDEIEQADITPKSVHAHGAKLVTGCVMSQKGLVE
jgi:hypothetical protein